MADFDKINIDDASYNVRDATARQQISAEITDREHADTMLSQKIGKETTAREHADTLLSQQISEETTAREQAVAGLTEQFSEITAALYKTTVLQYGAKGDGVADDTAAIKAMYTDVGYIVLGKGTFRVTDTIAVTGGCILGFGEVSVLQMDATVNKPVVKASNRAFLQGFNICFKSKPSDSTKDSYIGILCGKDPYPLQRTSIRNIHIYNVGTGISSEDPDSPIFEIHFDSIEITDFSYAGFNIITNGSTNCTFSNIYISNYNINTHAAYGFHLAGWMSSMEIASLNVEWGTYNIPILIVGCADLHAGVIHLERLKLAAVYNGLVTLSSVSGRISSLSVYYCDTSVAGTGIVRLKNATLWGDTEDVGTPIGTVSAGTCALFIDTLLLDRLNVDKGGIADSKDFCVFQRLQEFQSDYYTVCVGAYQYRPLDNDKSAYLNKYVISFNDNIQFISKSNTPVFASTLPDTRMCAKYRTIVYQTGVNSYKIFNGDAWDTITTHTP